MSERKRIDLTGISIEPVFKTIDNLLDKISHALGWLTYWISANPYLILKCKLCWSIGDLTHLIYYLKDEIYIKKGLGFPELQHLDSIGLVLFRTVGYFTLTGFGSRFLTSYRNDHRIVINFPETTEGVVNVGEVLFTKSG